MCSCTHACRVQCQRLAPQPPTTGHEGLPLKPVCEASCTSTHKEASPRRRPELISAAAVRRVGALDEFGVRGVCHIEEVDLVLVTQHAQQAPGAHHLSQQAPARQQPLLEMRKVNAFKQTVGSQQEADAGCRHKRKADRTKKLTHCALALAAFLSLPHDSPQQHTASTRKSSSVPGIDMKQHSMAQHGPLPHRCILIQPQVVGLVA